MDKIIERRLRSVIELQLEQEQYGFRPNRATTDLIFTVRMMTEKDWEKKKELVLLFIDIKKMYNRVSRDKIWESLANRGLINKAKML